MNDLVCRGRTSSCVETPARAYRIWPTRENTALCNPCAARLRAMGMAIEDDRPEWRRRAEDGLLRGKDLTGAVR